MIGTHYFESHVTIDPPGPFSEGLFEFLCKEQKFRVAQLYKKNGEKNDTDAFCTGHGATYQHLFERMKALVSALSEAGFTVRRYKIEAVLFDSKQGDTL